MDRYQAERAAARDATDNAIVDCAYNAHKVVEEMYRRGQTETFRDERYTQFVLYQILCQKYGIDGPGKAGQVVLEFPAQLLQPFKTGGGKPRALDIAISPGHQLTLEDRIPVAMEMKLGANIFTSAKMADVQSDLIRLSFLRQRAVVEGPSAQKCYFITFGLKEELNDLVLPGFSMDYQRAEDRFKYDDVSFCWSLSITDNCNKDMVKSVFLDPGRAGRRTGFDLVNELCVKLLADTTSDFFGPFPLNEPAATFKTGVKVWMVCMPNLAKGFITD